jgi:hypothetical protein
MADSQLDEEGKTIKQDETEELKKDEGVVMVESRASHLAQAAPTAEKADSSEAENGDMVKLTSKKKKPKKTSSDDNGKLF